MKITYDPEADAVYIKFKSEMFRTEHWSESVAADYDVDGHLVGIEVLDASNQIEDWEDLKALDYVEYATRRD